jgi:hypothetical protein
MRVSGNQQDVQRQAEDLESLEREFGIQIFKRLDIEGLSGTDALEDVDIQSILAELREPQ